MGLVFPLLYAIVDRETLDARGIAVRHFAEELRDGGVRLLQYRDKKNGPQKVLRAARDIAHVFAGVDATFILNDRADLAALLGWGVHVGQGDLPVETARRLVGDAIVGISTHNDDQLVAAGRTSADYVAIGPVFPTVSKRNADTVVGIEGVKRARAIMQKPLVAIGGITADSVAQVRGAGADSIAVIGALLASDASTAALSRNILRATESFHCEEA